MSTNIFIRLLGELSNKAKNIQSQNRKEQDKKQKLEATREKAKAAVKRVKPDDKRAVWDPGETRPYYKPVWDKETDLTLGWVFTDPSRTVFRSRDGLHEIELQVEDPQIFPEITPPFTGNADYAFDGRLANSSTYTTEGFYDGAFKPNGFYRAEYYSVSYSSSGFGQNQIFPITKDIIIAVSFWRKIYYYNSLLYYKTWYTGDDWGPSNSASCTYGDQELIKSESGILATQEGSDAVIVGPNFAQKISAPELVNLLIRIRGGEPVLTNYPYESPFYRFNGQYVAFGSVLTCAPYWDAEHSEGYVSYVQASYGYETEEDVRTNLFNWGVSEVNITPGIYASINNASTVNEYLRRISDEYTGQTTQISNSEVNAALGNPPVPSVAYARMVPYIEPTSPPVNPEDAWAYGFLSPVVYKTTKPEFYSDARGVFIQFGNYTTTHWEDYTWTLANNQPKQEAKLEFPWVPYFISDWGEPGYLRQEVSKYFDVNSLGSILNSES